MIAPLLGQCLSLAITLSGTANEHLYRRHGVNFAASETCLVYASLLLLCLPVFALTTPNPGPSLRLALSRRGLLYAGFALLDCVASLATIKAYLYLSVSMVALLSASTTPMVMVLSRLFLRTTFRTSQCVGAALCILGVALSSAVLCLKDSRSQDAVKGGVLALASAAFYAASNVVAEVLSNSAAGSSEFLLLAGSFGLAWSLASLCIFQSAEWPLLKAQPSEVYWLILGYVAAVVFFYALIPVFLKKASATLFSLSLFTINIYSFFVSYFVFQTDFSWSYPLSLVIVAAGIAVYSL